MKTGNNHSGETAREREARWRSEEQLRKRTEDAIAIYVDIGELRKEEGATVLICCSNPGGHGPDSEAVEVTSDWTNWQPHRFEGSTLRFALENAVREKKFAAKVAQ